MKLLSISRILGRQGLIKNHNLSKIKNDLREEDVITSGCASTNSERYYYIDEREKNKITNKKRNKFLKNNFF